MGISLNRDELQARLEEAVSLAESNDDLPATWTKRTERIGECPSKTYVAALGTALLARATDARVDAMTVKAGVAPNAYSMRGVVSVLAARAGDYGYHLGRTGPEPLNNQPWFHGTRVDRFEPKAAVRPFQREYVRWMRDLNHMDEEEALRALAGFIRVRQAYLADLAEQQVTIGASASAFDALVELVTRFVNDDPEGGRRGQAMVAALLDCVYEDVQLASINDPRSLDVAINVAGEPDLAIEVKQKAVTEATALHLAEESAAAGSDKALLAAIASDQSPLDRESVRLQAAEEHGVVVGIVESVAELFTQVALWSERSAEELAEDFPGAYLKRMREHEVSDEGCQYWVDLVAELPRRG